MKWHHCQSQSLKTSSFADFLSVLLCPCTNWPVPCWMLKLNYLITTYDQKNAHENQQCNHCVNISNNQILAVTKTCDSLMFIHLEIVVKSAMRKSRIVKRAASSTTERCKVKWCAVTSTLTNIYLLQNHLLRWKTAFLLYTFLPFMCLTINFFFNDMTLILSLLGFPTIQDSN